MDNKSWFRSQDAYVASFLMPVLIMILIFIQRGITPFGDESFLRMDMYHQYAPFFSEFRHKLQNGGSLLYTWNLGLGSNFSAIYAYYLASPVNWLLILVPKEWVLEFMAYLIVFKIGLAGLIFSYYLKQHSKLDNFGITFFAIFYALSGYMAAYNWNIMWLDCIVVFPLVVLGLERLVYKRKFLLYTLSLAFCISSNYYISIMICLFLVIYYIALVIMKKYRGFKDLAISWLQFAFFSILAAAMSLVILLPEIYALGQTASGKFDFPKTYSAYFSIVDMLARHMPSIETHTGLEHWPNIYCGIAVYILVLLYVVNDKISLKERVTYISMAIFMLASFAVNVLNYIWHGLHYPNSLPARQSFIYIFLILYMSYKAYEYLMFTSMKKITVATLASISFVLLMQEFAKDENIHFAVYYASLILLGVYALLIYIFKKGRLNINILLFIILAVVSVEAAVNTTITSASTVNKTEYTKDNASIRYLMKAVKGSGLYRFDKTERKTKDDGAWLNFPSVSVFSSTAFAGMSDFYKSMGAEATTNAYSITGATPLFDMLMSVRYGFYKGESQNKNLKLISSDKDTYLYENPYTLPIAYVVSHDIEDNWDDSMDMQNPASVQNDLSNLLGLPPVLDKIEGKLEGTTYSFIAPEAGNYYIYVTNPKIEDVSVSRGDTNTSYENLNRKYFIEIYDVKMGEEISLISNTTEETIEAEVYRFDYESLGSIYEEFSKEAMEVQEYKDDYIKGTVALAKRGVLMTSIPYDKGWELKVDGVRVETKKAYDAFIAVNLEAGTHSIELSYMPEGLIYGAIATGASVSLLLIIILIFKMLSLRKGKSLDAKLIEEEYEEDEEAEEENSEQPASEPEGVEGIKAVPKEEIMTEKEKESDEDKEK